MQTQLDCAALSPEGNDCKGWDWKPGLGGRKPRRVVGGSQYAQNDRVAAVITGLQGISLCFLSYMRLPRNTFLGWGERIFQ